MATATKIPGMPLHFLSANLTLITLMKKKKEKTEKKERKRERKERNIVKRIEKERKI